MAESQIEEKSIYWCMYVCPWSRTSTSTKLLYQTIYVNSEFSEQGFSSFCAKFFKVEYTEDTVELWKSSSMPKNLAKTEENHCPEKVTQIV